VAAIALPASDIEALFGMSAREVLHVTIDIAAYETDRLLNQPWLGKVPER
jgi:hypothetical protein